MAVTIGRFLQEARTALASASPTARLDAEVLVRHATGLDRAALIARDDQHLTVSQETHLRQLLARRQQGEPIAYLVGSREFWSMDLMVTPDVLIPRPETEHLVEEALQHLPPEFRGTIADLGTGSGAIALALARERPHCQVIAIDAAAAALDVARDNAKRLGIPNIEFRLGEWFNALGGMQFDLIASNPPYVRAGDPHLEQGDLRFEPRAALVAGRDGLDAIRIITAGASAHLCPGGWLVLEHGFDQAEQVAALLRRQGFEAIRSTTDLAGQVRITAGCRMRAHPQETHS